MIFIKVGYVRCSTEEQNESRQVVMMNEQGCEKIYTDKASGKNTNREEFKKMMEYVRDGDIVITESISRIARNTKDLLNIVDTLNSRNVGFVSMKENIDTATPQGKFMLTVFAAMAELERESILERQREGIAIAKAEGKYKGKQPISLDEKKFRKVCARWRSGEITAVQAQKELDLKPNTFYRRVKSLGI